MGNENVRLERVGRQEVHVDVVVGISDGTDSACLIRPQFIHVDFEQHGLRAITQNKNGGTRA